MSVVCADTTGARDMRRKCQQRGPLMRTPVAAVAAPEVRPAVSALLPAGLLLLVGPPGAGATHNGDDDPGDSAEDVAAMLHVAAGVQE